MQNLCAFFLYSVEYTVIEELAANYMNSSCENSTELLFFMMIAKGMLHLQRGTNPAIIADVFASFVGIEQAAAFKDVLSVLVEALWEQYEEDHEE